MQQTGKTSLVVIIRWDSSEDSHWTCVDQVTFDPHRAIDQQRAGLRLIDSCDHKSVPYNKLAKKRGGVPVGEGDSIDSRLLVLYHSTDPQDAASYLRRFN